MSKQILEYNRTSTYDKLETLVKDMGCKRLIFSMFQTRKWSNEKDPEWIIVYPDLLSDKPAFNGSVQFRCDYWRVTDDEVISPVLENPTWKDALLAIDELLKDGDGQGVFLEALYEHSRKDGVVVYDCSIGS